MKVLSLCLLLVVAVVAVRNDGALSEASMSAPVPKAPSLVETAASAAEGSAADVTAQAAAQLEAALGLEGESEAEAGAEGENADGQKRGFLKVLYDELKKLSDGSFAPMPSSTSPSSSSLPADVADPRVAALEKRLAMFERKRAKVANRAQDAAIAGINERLVDLDKTLASLKRSSEQQQQLAQQLLRGAGNGPDSVDTRPDFSVLYAKATLPADFDARVQEILDTVRVQARKIYEKHCANTPRPGTGTPKSYPREKTPKIKGLRPAPPAAAGKRRRNVPGPAPRHPGRKPTAGAAKFPRLPPRKPADPNADDEEEVQQKHSAPVPLIKPVMKGHEPTPQELRKLKAMLDLQKKLPITPAYHLPDNQKALHDVLGEDAVGNKWKST